MAYTSIRHVVFAHADLGLGRTYTIAELVLYFSLWALAFVAYMNPPGGNDAH